MAVLAGDGTNKPPPKPFGQGMGSTPFGAPFNKPTFTPTTGTANARSQETDVERDKKKQDAEANAVVARNGGIGLQGQFDATDMSEYVNPPPDYRLNSIIRKMRSPLLPGVLQQTDDIVFAPQRHPYACRFMFNPTTISVKYASQETAYPMSALTPAQLGAERLGPGTTSLSFSLLFDRTYEVAYGGPLAKLGVYRDIAALESVVGARFNFAVNAGDVIQPMQLNPCYFIFGGGAGTVGLSFIGAITSLGVTYATFSERLVPMRASVDIEVTQTLGGDLAKLRSEGGTLLTRMAARARDENSARAGRGN